MLFTAPDEHVRKAMRASWALLIAALLIPPVLGALGVLSAPETASDLVAYGFGWVVSAVLVDFIQRSRGAQAKATGRLVVSTFTLVTAVIAGATAYYRDVRAHDVQWQLLEELMKANVRASKPRPAASSGPGHNVVAPDVVGVMSGRSTSSPAVSRDSISAPGFLGLPA